ELNYEFASNFMSYLLSSDPANDRTGMTDVSAAGVIKKMRTIFTHAVELELISRNPFKQIKLKIRSPRKERLTIDQLKKLAKINLTGYNYQQLYLDLFLFAVCTGLAYQDLMSLTWHQLQKRENGQIKLLVKRVKTNVSTESFLPSLAIDIAEKYRSCDPMNTESRAFPSRSNKEFNSQLKLLANLSNIPI